MKPGFTSFFKGWPRPWISSPPSALCVSAVRERNLSLQGWRDTVLSPSMRIMSTCCFWFQRSGGAEELQKPQHAPGTCRCPGCFCGRGLSRSAFDWPACSCRRRRDAGGPCAEDASEEWLLLPYSTPTFFKPIAMVTTSLSASRHLPRRQLVIGCLSQSHPVIGQWWRPGAPPSPVSRVSRGAQEGGSASAAGPGAAGTGLRQSLAGHVGRPGLGQEPPEGRRRRGK